LPFVSEATTLSPAVKSETSQARAATSLPQRRRRAHAVPQRPCVREVRSTSARARAGLSLVETCALLSLSGVLAAAFVPSFLRHLRFSKIVEATEQLDALYRSTAAYYATEQHVEGRLARGCLPKGAGPTPKQPSVDPQFVDFASIDVVGRETWRALGRSTGLLRYSYQVQVFEPGCGPRPAPPYPAVTFQASGDLDGDGHFSLLERSASISSDQQALMPVIPLRITDRIE
jgi:type II secretory pathway pseudopilin PulG